MKRNGFTCSGANNKNCTVCPGSCTSFMLINHPLAVILIVKYLNSFLPQFLG